MQFISKCHFTLTNSIAALETTPAMHGILSACIPLTHVIARLNKAGAPTLCCKSQPPPVAAPFSFVGRIMNILQGLDTAPYRN